METKKRSRSATPRARKDASGTPRGKSKNTEGVVLSPRAVSADSNVANVTAGDVLLYYPNIVGYIRVVCMVLSFYYAKSNWKRALVYYLAAFIGDVVDGHVARSFDQCSKVGGILDMVTDRVSTCGFLVLLSNFYPEHYFTAIMLIVLDISSHWFHVMSVSGHHKSKESLQNRNALLQWYYSIYPLFGYCCVGTELFYILLYVLRFHPDPVIHQICFYGCFPACAMKQIVNVAQLFSAMDNVARIDAAERNEKKSN